jgi:hypothetical protein
VSKGWPLVPMEDIFAIARGGSPRPIDSFLTDDPDGVNWVMISDATESGKYINSTKKRIREDGTRWRGSPLDRRTACENPSLDRQQPTTYLSEPYDPLALLCVDRQSVREIWFRILTLDRGNNLGLSVGLFFGQSVPDLSAMYCPLSSHRAFRRMSRTTAR